MLGHGAQIDSRAYPSLSSMSFYQASKETDAGGVDFYLSSANVLLVSETEHPLDI